MKNVKNASAINYWQIDNKIKTDQREVKRNVKKNEKPEGFHVTRGYNRGGHCRRLSRDDYPPVYHNKGPGPELY